MAFHEMHHQSNVTKTSIKYLHYCWQNHNSYQGTNSLVPTHTKQAFLLYTPFTSGTDFTSRLTLFPSHATLILSTRGGSNPTWPNLPQKIHSTFTINKTSSSFNQFSWNFGKWYYYYWFAFCTIFIEIRQKMKNFY